MSGPVVRPVGPQPAAILLVGEAPGEQEAKEGIPFVGVSGKELTRMLHEAGIERESIRITNVVQVRPPGNDIGRFISDKPVLGWKLHRSRWVSPEAAAGLYALEKEVEATSPSAIIALGDTALWALTGERGITKWRGSVIARTDGPGVIIPTYHPAAILRMWSWRFVAVNDLRRARLHADGEGWTERWWRTTAPPMQVIGNEIAALNRGEKRTYAVDIETRKGRIDCIGLAWRPHSGGPTALVVPFERMDGTSTMDVEEEVLAVAGLRRILLHPNAKIVGQNWLYDSQYIARNWGFYAPAFFDTMIAQGVCWPSLPKSLDFLSSLYLDDHLYWKDDIKEAAAGMNDEQRWSYNAEDCVRTLRVYEALDVIVEKRGLREQFNFEMELCRPLFFMMLRGVRADMARKGEFLGKLMAARYELAQWFDAVLPPDANLGKSDTPWYDSPAKVKALMFNYLHQPIAMNRKTGRPTTDDEALARIGRREPLLLPLTERLAHYRSLGVFMSTFVQARLDHDKRWRCSYNPVGTETFRFSSSADVFGFGTNLQNIPKGD